MGIRTPRVGTVGGIIRVLLYRSRVAEQVSESVFGEVSQHITEDVGESAAPRTSLAAATAAAGVFVQRVEDCIERTFIA